MQMRFVRLIWENQPHTIASLYFKPDKPYYFAAGQYADVVVPHDNPDSRGVARTMTFMTSPSKNEVGFTTRFFGKGNSSYKNALLQLTPGAVVSVTDSMGDLVLPLDSSVPLVFVAGGVAIASYVSMVQWLTEQQDVRDVTLLYAVRSTGDIIFQEQFDAYGPIGKLQKTIFTTDNKIDTLQVNGAIKKSRLTSADIIAAVKPNAQIYISGNESMVEQLHHELEDKHNIPQYRIAFDFFEGYSGEI